MFFLTPFLSDSIKVFSFYHLQFQLLLVFSLFYSLDNSAACLSRLHFDNVLRCPLIMAVQEEG